MCHMLANRKVKGKMQCNYLYHCPKRPHERNQNCLARHREGPPDGGEQLGGADDTPGTGTVLPCPVTLVESKPKPAQRGTHAASKRRKE